MTLGSDLKDFTCHIHDITSMWFYAPRP